MKKCSYIKNGKKINDTEINELMEGVVNDDVIKTKNAQYSAASVSSLSKLDEFKSDASYHSVSKSDGGVEIKVDSENGISFNDFIDNAISKDGKKWIKNFDEEEYKNSLRNKVKTNPAGLVYKGKTYTKSDLELNDTIVNEYVNMKVEQNRKTGEVGMSVHRAMTKFMNYKNEDNNKYLSFIKLDGDKITDSKGNILPDDNVTIEFINELKNDENFKNMDLNAFVKFYNSALSYKYKDLKKSEKITNYLTSSNDPIIGKDIYALIDLITVDSDGKINLIFYNVSNSDHVDWTDEKRERLIYKMMMARHMLINKGIDPKLIHVRIKPIAINYDDDMNIVDVSANKGDISLTSLPSSGKNTKFDNQVQGSYAANINEVIPLAPSCFASSVKIEGVEEIAKQMSHLFSSYNFRGRESDSEYQDFISSKVKASDDMTKGAWMYWNIFDKKYVYIEDDGKNKEDSPNVRSEIVSYVTRRRDESNNVLENIGEIINDILSGKKDMETSLSSIFRTQNDKGKMYLSYILSKYVSDNEANSTK